MTTESWQDVSPNVHKTLKDPKDSRASLAGETLPGQQQARGTVASWRGQASQPCVGATGLMTDKENYSRSGNKIHRTPPPGVLAQPKKADGEKNKQCLLGQEGADQSPRRRGSLSHLGTYNGLFEGKGTS